MSKSPVRGSERLAGVVSLESRSDQHHRSTGFDPAVTDTRVFLLASTDIPSARLYLGATAGHEYINQRALTLDASQAKLLAN